MWHFSQPSRRQDCLHGGSRCDDSVKGRGDGNANLWETATLIGCKAHPIFPRPMKPTRLDSLVVVEASLTLVFVGVPRVPAKRWPSHGDTAANAVDLGAAPTASGSRLRWQRTTFPHVAISRYPEHRAPASARPASPTRRPALRISATSHF
eukprot:SAG31_NODE_605_length_13628_cov_24.848030_8_plen_151_part_00